MQPRDRLAVWASACTMSFAVNAYAASPDAAPDSIKVHFAKGAYELDHAAEESLHRARHGIWRSIRTKS